MRLLLYTQIVDRHDSSLGFMVSWIEKIAHRADAVEVVCLKKGTAELPENVRVYSLGKEEMIGNRIVARFLYIVRFYAHLFRMSKYDAVLVHMNEEYVLLGGWFWRLCGKRVYLWRNHYEGSFLTKIAGALATKVFYTSSYSYTARFANAHMMPVGVDVGSLREEIAIERVPHSILFLGRMDISKRAEVLIDALGILQANNVSFTATFVGGPTDPESSYPHEMKKRAAACGIEHNVVFTGAVPNSETFRYYRSHELFVNCSRSGMLDKTTFKAIAAGCLVLSSSADLKRELSDEFFYADGDSAELAQKLERLLALSSAEKTERSTTLQSLVAKNTLPVLVDTLMEEMAGTRNVRS